MRIRNFYKVDELLACAGQPGEAALKQMAAEGYQVVVNLGLLNTVYALPDEAATVAALGMEYYHIPVVFDKPQLSELNDFIDFMTKHRQQKIMVHCAANYRASVFTGLYLLSAGRLDEAELIDFVDDAWQMDEVWKGFLEMGILFVKAVD
jgi:protein tyrosine phosphatase (PTP) superfamily phosphohydrolase (DUF442 family)